LPLDSSFSIPFAFTMAYQINISQTGLSQKIEGDLLNAQIRLKMLERQFQKF